MSSSVRPSKGSGSSAGFYSPDLGDFEEGGEEGWESLPSPAVKEATSATPAHPGLGEGSVPVSQDLVDLGDMMPEMEEDDFEYATFEGHDLADTLQQQGSCSTAA